MRFVHRIGLRATPAKQRDLEALGVKLPTGIALPGEDPLFAFDVDEDHPNWLAMSALFQKWKVSDVLSTQFTRKEIETARWLNLIPDWHHGYPQPDEDVFGYREATYDLTEWCEQCGTGMKQKAPFQMKGEPKWGKRSILQLNWVFGEYFVTPEAWTRVFKPHGVGSRPVTNTKGVELKTVVQLVIEEEVGIVSEGLPSERCAACGRVKYLPVTRGPFPPLAEEPSRAMVKTKEYFGSGGQADQLVLVSQKLAQSLAAEKVTGASVQPVHAGITE